MFVFPDHKNRENKYMFKSCIHVKDACMTQVGQAADGEDKGGSGILHLRLLIKTKKIIEVVFLYN